MTGPATAGIATTTGAAAMLMTLVPLGLSPTLLFLGGASFFGGCCARTALALFKKLNSPDVFSGEFFARQGAMLMCCIPLAAVASCIVFLGAIVSKADVEKDAAALCGFLLITGLRGPEGFQWIADASTSIFTKFAPGQKPGGGGP